MNRDEIRAQFGRHARHYVASKTHAKGASLQRLVEVTGPQPEWHVLDIATAAGHTAFAFAPHVAHVWATDITEEMLALAAEQVAERSFENVTVEFADAEDLPYADGAFDLVTCRIAPHHFVDVMPFLRESARVLKPGGLLAVVDNVVPSGPAGDYVNAFEKFRDPSHGRCLDMGEWQAAFVDAGFTVERVETLDKQVAFAAWAGRHDALMQRYLLAMLSEVAGEAAAFLQPHLEGEALHFRLQEGLLLGRK